MTSIIRDKSLRFIVEPESIPNIPNEVGAEQLIVGENASIAIEVLGSQGRDVWIFSVACLLENGSEHPAFKVTKHDQRLVAIERDLNSIYLMKSGVTVRRVKPQGTQREEECLILRFEVFVSGCDSPLTLTSSNIFFKSPLHFTPEIADVHPRNAVPDGSSFLILNMNYGKYASLKKRVFANFTDNHGWMQRTEAIRRQKPVNGIEFKVPIPKYTKPLTKDIDIMVTIESHLFKQSKKKIKNSKPFLINFFLSKNRKRTVEKIVDYREYSTDEDERENKDDNTRRGRRKSYSRYGTKSRGRALSDAKRKRHSTTNSEEDSQTQSTYSEEDILNYLNMIGDNAFTNKDIIELIRILNLDMYDLNINELMDAFEETSSKSNIEFDQYSEFKEEDDFEEILASMHAFNEDLSDLLDLSTISEEHNLKRVIYKEKCPLLSEHEMNKIIKELQEDSKEDFMQHFDIPEDNVNNENKPNKDEISLIEETLKTMALELPKPFDSQPMEFEDEDL